MLSAYRRDDRPTSGQPSKRSNKQRVVPKPDQHDWPICNVYPAKSASDRLNIKHGWQTPRRHWITLDHRLELAGQSSFYSFSSGPNSPMPIQIKCKCGKTLGIPDGMAGKAVKCPGCKQVLRVPGGTGSKAKAPVRAAAPARDAVTDSMSELFDEEGLSAKVEAVCPACRAEMSGNAVLCTKCGYHKESGTSLDGHKTAGVDIDHGTLALDKAAVDMEAAAELQRRMLRGAGLPWWGLALALFMLGSGLLIAVLAVNASRREDEVILFNPMQLFLILSGSGFLLVGLGAQLLIVVHAAKQSALQCVLCLFAPFYILYHVCVNWGETWRYFVTNLVAISIAIGLFIAASMQ